MTDEEMQACLEAGDLPGTPREVRAIEKAYALGRASMADAMQRVHDLTCDASATAMAALAGVEPAS